MLALSLLTGRPTEAEGGHPTGRAEREATPQPTLSRSSGRPRMGNWIAPLFRQVECYREGTEETVFPNVRGRFTVVK